MKLSRILPVVAGAGLGAFAIARGPSLLGAVVWSAAVLLACHGYGLVLERLTRVRVSAALTVVTGLSLLCAVGTLVARAGLLHRNVELGALLLGLAACALPRSGPPVVPNRNLVLTVISIATGVLLVIVVLGKDLPPIGGGANHVLSIKRMWDLGGFGMLHQQLGFQLVGESLFSWATGAQIAAIFEAGVCAGLVVWMLASELASRPAIGIPAFVIMAVPVALYPENSDQWSGVLLHMCAFFTLGPAIAERRTAWHTIVFSVALMTLRTEYIVLAVPYLVAAVVMPRFDRLPRRAIAIAIAAWTILLLGFQIILAVPPMRAVWNLLPLLAVIPVVWLVGYLAGIRTWRSAFSTLWFASLSALVAVFVDAIRASQHIETASVALWFVLGAGSLASLELVEDRDPHEPIASSPGRMVPGAGAFVLAIVFSAISFTPYFAYDRYGMMLRHYHAVMMFRDQVNLGCMMWTHEDVRAMQEIVPPGAKLLFWGQSAALLDFRRNQIRDTSWPAVARARRERNFLPSLTPESLRGAEYLILEDLESNSAPDPWDMGYVATTAAVEDRLLEVGRSGVARLYRVR